MYRDNAERLLRNDTAKHYREVRRLLQGSDCCDLHERRPSRIRNFDWAKAILIVLAVLAILFSTFKICHGKEYSNEEICKAIRKAEGNSNYGIISVKCSSESECRKVCLRTIRNNRKRYAKVEQSYSGDFVHFLATRYAPIGAGNDPKGLNKNWEKNVRWFLYHPRVEIIIK